MPVKILFIHGLASSGRYKMADQLRILVPDSLVLSPDVPPEPDEALPMLKRLCQEFVPDIVVGHSLGGFWAQKLRGWRKALVNPTFHIADFLEPLKGRMEYLSPRSDGERFFEITDGMIQAYRALEAVEFEGLSPEEKALTTAFFADSDEIVRQEAEFRMHYGKPGISYPGHHQPVFPEMKHFIVPGILEQL